MPAGCRAELVPHQLPADLAAAQHGCCCLGHLRSLWPTASPVGAEMLQGEREVKGMTPPKTRKANHDGSQEKAEGGHRSPLVPGTAVRGVAAQVPTQSSWGSAGLSAHTCRQHPAQKREKKKNTDRGKEQLLKEIQSADRAALGGWTRLCLGLLNHRAKWFPLHLTGELLLCSAEKVSCSNKRRHNGESIH